jgi:hypothetical protein
VPDNKDKDEGQEMQAQNDDMQELDLARHDAQTSGNVALEEGEEKENDKESFCFSFSIGYDNGEDQVHHQTRDQTDEGSTCTKVQYDRPPHQERKYNVHIHIDIHIYIHIHIHIPNVPIQQEGKGCSHHDGEAPVPQPVPVHQKVGDDADEGSMCLTRCLNQCQAFQMGIRGEGSVSASSEDDLSEEEEEEEFCNFAALSFLACLV